MLLGTVEVVCALSGQWTSSQLSGWGLLPHHQRSPEKTAFGRDSCACHQSDEAKLRWQSLQFSWTLSLELSSDSCMTSLAVWSPSAHFRSHLYSVGGTKVHQEPTPLFPHSP